MFGFVGLGGSVPLRWSALLLLAWSVGACTHPAATDGGTAADVADVGPTLDGSDATDVVSSTDASMTGPDVTVTTGATIEVPGIPRVMRGNDTTHQLYVSLRTQVEGGLGVGAGIAVIDESTNTVTMTVPPPTPVFIGMPAIFDSLAIDESANKIYLGAFAGDTGTIRVIDGATGTMSAIPPLDTRASGIGALAVDAANHRLYAWVSESPQPKVGIWDTASGMLVTSVTISDLSDGSPTDHFAIDPVNHRLFVCGVNGAMNLAAAYDTIDTTMNARVGTQHVYDPTADGYFVGCGGGPGYAALMTNGTTSSPAVLYELEPARITLPPDFVPNEFSVYENPGDPPGTHQIAAFGLVGGNQWQEFRATIVNERVTFQYLIPAGSNSQLYSCVRVAPLGSDASDVFYLSQTNDPHVLEFVVGIH